MLGVWMLKITAWTLLGFGVVWWLLLTFLVVAFRASGAGWVFVGGLAALSIPIGVLRLLRAPDVARVVGAGLVTAGVGVGLALWADLDEIVFGSRELGWIVIAIGLASAGAAWLDRPDTDGESNG